MYNIFLPLVIEFFSHHQRLFKENKIQFLRINMLRGGNACDENDGYLGRPLLENNVPEYRVGYRKLWKICQ